jgi:small-conductance mechanosensitive channel
VKLFISIGGIFLFLGFYASGFGQQPLQKEPSSLPDKAEKSTDRKFADLIKTLQATIDMENEKIEALKNQVVSLENSEKDLVTELNTHRLQLTNYGNLLLLPDTRIKDLEEAHTQIQVAFLSISKKLKEISEKVEDVKLVQLQLKEHRIINERHSTELSSGILDNDEKKQAIGLYKKIAVLFSEKEKLLEQVDKHYRSILERYDQTRKQLNTLAQNLLQKIESKNKEELFKRKTAPLGLVSLKQLRDETIQVIQKVGFIGTADFWKSQFNAIWAASEFYLITFIILLMIYLVLLIRLCASCNRLKNHPNFEHHPWGRFAFILFQKNMILFGLLAFIYLYSLTSALNAASFFYKMTFGILFVWLLTGWALDFLTLWEKRDGTGNSNIITFSLRLLIKMVRWFSIGYLVLDWLIGASLMIILARIAFELALIIWLANFWKKVNADVQAFLIDKHPHWQPLNSVFKWFGYLVFGGGLLLDLSGYSILAKLWLTSWGKTSIVFLWSILIFLVIREFEKRAAMVTHTEIDGTKWYGDPLRWILTRVFWVFWFLGSIAGLFLSWGAKQAFFHQILNAVSYKIQIGQIGFSVLTFVYMVLVLVLTHTAARIWRRFLRDQILESSGLRRGMKESIASLSVYLIWAFGILVSLHVFGLSTTSLAVAFGALGIGLGFGLQNIFSNFISGIILLFERPIQVGDAIEINNIWGEVRQINFRSTVVQTYDNATLIIPNSEFISARVTNWSFKDVRVRRHINVGVAYGSNTQLVKSTLLEVAAKTPKVLSNPAPIILFSDFGDNSLIFRLRFWTDVDNMLLVETDMRFEIDRLFRERGIEISFPQRDLHIRSVDRNVRFDIRSLAQPQATSGPVRNSEESNEITVEAKY